MKAFKVFIDFKQPLNKYDGFLYQSDEPIGTIICENETEARKQLHEASEVIELPEYIYSQLRLEETRLQDLINQ